MFVITGATGNTGSKLAEILLDKGSQVRVIGRSEDKLQSFVAKGAEARVGNMEDVQFLTDAFQGATAVFALIPPNLHVDNVRLYQNEVGQVIAQAIVNAGVSHVVNLSSFGAHLPDNNGPIGGLYDQEQRLNSLEAVNVVHLRPTYFMENLLWNVDLIKGQGFNGSPLKPDLQFPVIATRDIAVVAAEYLENRNFKGKVVRELLGERDLSMLEMTKIIGQEMGKSDLAYVQFPYEDAEQSLRSMGLSADAARLMVELNRSLNEGVIGNNGTRTRETTTETSFEEFAQIFTQL